MKLKPLGDRVVVKPLEAAEKTKSGIVLPDTAKEKPQQGKVEAVGKGRQTDDGKVLPMEVKVGNTILYGKYSGTEVTIDDEEYVVLHESDILAIVE
ncbi:MAG TPA: co-chaperone GroES [bacterium]|uniref:Co-chaperonin GroES n=1 Tax=candidate division TA06 bacterium ADurb.Bin417 TaxID=1852828 RepID=A0A1V5MG25_UNCT6|nr:MAG: 10 kDa chaperonin [candidate division TA06 bacterium ADurb.Bin417]HNQ36029.1 co-chaperone GroES [bacterium]HNS48188.1 co-chaperone GroES [bacterium]